jgi:hypothetical protein
MIGLGGVHGAIPVAIVWGIVLGTILLAAFLVAAIARRWWVQTYYFAPRLSFTETDVSR